MPDRILVFAEWLQKVSQPTIVIKKRGEHMESLTLYKLIILYMLDKVNFPLTNAQITDFILMQEYTTYFILQQAIAELIDSDLIKAESDQNSSMYHLTENGQDTLHFFENKISDAIKSDIEAYLKEHSYEMRNAVSVITDYYKTPQQEFACHCKLKERDSDLVDLTITVPTREQAELVCSNWRNHNQEIYMYLMESLLQEE